jgi:alpha-galactosidase
MSPMKSALLAFTIILTTAAFAAADSVRLTELGTVNIRQDWGLPGIDKSVDNKPLSIGGKPFEHGLGTHATSTIWIQLDGNADRFTASVGMDDEVAANPDARNAGVEFNVLGDGKRLFTSGKMKPGAAAQSVDVDLHGVKAMVLVVQQTGNLINFDHADWAEATIQYSGERPMIVEPPREPAIVLTPKPPATPRINGTKIFGVRPGHPVLYTIAASGERPMTFAAEGLPAGLSLESQTGRISGSVGDAGTFVAKIMATNAKGITQRDLRIVVGDTIALTPPMGWNSWNCFATAVSDEKVRSAADAMVTSGLIDHGWTYVNIDDCWEVPAREPEQNRRDAQGRIKTNRKFPDMKALADYIHGKGLRAGLYSSPGPSTCGGFTASYQFEEKDAEQYAAWGFDYPKYDWCSYGRIADQIKKSPNPPSGIEILQHPYTVMNQALRRQDRDIVFSLCQYGMGDVWKWGEKVGGNCWRTTGDITDTWHSMTSNGFNETGHEQFAGPGHWNDPDMLVLGKVGWGPALHPTRLTPNEQYTHVTLWSLLSSPLLIGCDMTQLDDFTLSLLTNDEVIAVDQDPLGKQASRISNDSQTQVWAKDLEDGTKAVGLFNLSEMATTVTVKWSDLGLKDSQAVRDLWRQKDLGTFNEHYSAEIPRHGAVMIKVGHSD